MTAPAQLVLLELCLLDLELGAATGEIRLGGLEVVLGDQRVDLGQQIPLLDLLASLHREIGNLTGDLGTDIHLLDGLQYPAGQHGLLHILTGHLGGQHRLGCLARPDQPADGEQEDEGEQGNFSLLGSYVHVSPERSERRRARAISCSKRGLKNSDEYVRKHVDSLVIRPGL